MSKSIELIPDPAALISSLRDIGYSIETAIADLIDNSITAASSTIDIRYLWNSGHPWLAVIDDGIGMSRPELIDAMRFGSSHPDAERHKDDLGRFGLGLKTASFSQCRNLIVLSKKEDSISCFEWDLDKISQANDGRWSLEQVDNTDVEKHHILNQLVNPHINEFESGTIVLWQKMDRITSAGAEKNFNSTMSFVRDHIRLVFHRYLSPDKGFKKINILVNSDSLKAFNPFNPTSKTTVELPLQRIFIENHKVEILPFILPHHDKVSEEEWRDYAGVGGYTANQGFYIYRNRRLIIKGTWFRLLKKDELKKLIRVRVDIPNSMDTIWNIDIKKSQATPPEPIRKEFLQIINKIEYSGKRVFHQKGAKLKSIGKYPIWLRVAQNDEINYKINRDHPVLSKFFNFESGGEVNEELLSLIEASFPKDQFFSDYAGTPEIVNKHSEKSTPLIESLDKHLAVIEGILTERDTIIEYFASIEPFKSRLEETILLLEEHKFTNE